MKKLFSIILAVMMLVSCCAALAESENAALNIEGTDVSGLFTPKAEGGVTLKEASFAMAQSNDVVTVADSMIAVRSGSITMMLNLPTGYVCFTQDYFASIESYAMINDPEGLQRLMVENDCHFYLLDTIAMNESSIEGREADDLSMAIGNMKSLSDEDQIYIGTQIGSASGVDFRGVVKTGTASWLSFGGSVNLYMTVVGGTWLIYYAGNAMDIDAEDLLNSLSIYGG